MRLTYEFDDVWDFTYDVDTEDCKVYIYRTYDADEILFDYLNYLYPHQTPKFQQDIFTDYGFDGTSESIDLMSQEDKEELVDEIFDDLLDTGVYDDILRDAFESDALEAYEDSRMDPYAYNGVSRSDF